MRAIRSRRRWPIGCPKLLPRLKHRSAMHEMSFARSLLSQVEQLLVRNGGTAVEEIEVEVGPLTGVEPLLLREAFERLAPASASQGAALTIREIPLEARCRGCACNFAVESFRFRCPNCGSTSVQVIRGDEFRLLNVTIRQPLCETEARS
jgi:hydrogenase nickel incorporation protein HypA/HybF